MTEGHGKTTEVQGKVIERRRVIDFMCRVVYKGRALEIMTYGATI